MVNDQTLFLVSSPAAHLPAIKLNDEGHFIHLCFCIEQGQIDTNVLAECKDELSLEDVSFHGHNLLGPFVNLAKLNQFAYLLCEKLSSEEIVMLTLQDYNKCLEHAKKSADVFDLLYEKGNILENIDQKKGKGFFKKLFH
jgi:hypothetical protein